jgi:hypothetical protein
VRVCVYAHMQTALPYCRLLVIMATVHKTSTATSNTKHPTSNIDLGKKKKHDTHPIVNRDWFICTLCACKFCSKMRAPPVRKAMPGMRSRCRMTTPAMVAWRRRSLPMCVSYSTGRQVKSKVLLGLATYSHLIKRTMARVPSTAL